MLRGISGPKRRQLEELDDLFLSDIAVAGIV